MFFARFVGGFTLKYSLKQLASRPHFRGVNPVRVLGLLTKLEGADFIGAQERVWLFRIWLLAQAEYRLKGADCFQWHRIMAECSSLSRKAEHLSIPNYSSRPSSGASRARSANQ